MAANLEQKPIDEAKLGAFMGKAVTDFGSLASSALVIIGDKLGLYKAMAHAGPVTVSELARTTGTNERYIHEWLINQAAGGYIEYDPATDSYLLPDEHALALADENSPYYVQGGFELFTAAIKAEPRITEAFKSGDGMLWGEHDHGLFEGTERFFKPGYLGNLINSWIPALDGVKEKLKAGALVADVGCGHGVSTIIMAQAFPRSHFWGFDIHDLSISEARMAAARAGVSDRVHFEVAEADSYPGTNYDLIAFFDCLHDMGDPLAATTYARKVLAPDGTVLIVEPMAGENVQDNLNPVGRVYSAASVLVCTPHAMASGGKGLGTIATEARIRETVTNGGFTSFRRATETPLNRVFEAKI